METIYKVGDKVRLQSKQWMVDNNRKDMAETMSSKEFIIRTINYDLNDVTFENLSGYFSINNIKELVVRNRYLVLVQNISCPNVIHTNLEEAQKEAQRLAKKEATTTYVVEIINKYGIEVKELTI